MKKVLYIGFKGKNNSSSMLVNSLSSQDCLLTNSFAGLKKDIDNLSGDYDEVYLFGVDKTLTDSFRIERSAERENTRLTTALDIKAVSERLSAAGIKSTLSDNPTHFLCNEAYWYLLEKYRGRAVLIHIPTIKNYMGISKEF